MRAKFTFISIACLFTCTAVADVPQVGDMPVPVMNSASVGVHVTFDGPNNYYYYNYSITNPATNTGAITDVFIDLLAPPMYQAPTVGFDPTMPYGAQGNMDFLSVYYDVDNREFPHDDSVIEFGAQLPSGWMAQISADGNGAFDVTDDQYGIAPGQTGTGFIMYSPGVPTIKDMQLTPDWQLVISDGDPTDDEVAQADTVGDALTIHVSTLGPSPYFPMTDDHWSELQADVNKAIQLGWISDQTFGQALVSELASARQVFDSKGPNFIQDALTQLQNQVASSSASQRNQAAYDLLSLNLAAMIANLPPPGGDPQPQYSPLMSLSIQSATTLSVDGTAIFNVNVVDEANNNAPIPNYGVTVAVEGVNRNNYTGTTDANGNYTVSYQTSGLGTDTVILKLNSEQIADKATIQWQGGPDLKIQTFIPPLLDWSGTGPIHITESTVNVGTTVAGTSTTDYYISSSQPFDWNTAEYVGGRDVPALQPGQSDSNGGADWDLPPDITTGTYTMVACADDNFVVTELDETNNCQTSQIVLPLKKSTTQPPDCSKAGPTMAMLWPPNHKMSSVGIQGVTDPQNLQTTISIVGIQQDEPVNGTGDGDTAPDGAGIGTTTAQVRSERSGIAVGGRLYFINFKATDTAGGACTGVATVGVPHDKGQHNMPTDNGLRYDSTAMQ